MRSNSNFYYYIQTPYKLSQVMVKINLQHKTKAQKGTVEIYWFENKNIGLPKTLFHRIYIPLTPFNSGLEYESQPVDTQIIIEWINLNLGDPTNLDGLNLALSHSNETEVSIYIGSAHNQCDLKHMFLKKVSENLYEATIDLIVDFEGEGIAENEGFSIVTQLELDPIIKE